MRIVLASRVAQPPIIKRLEQVADIDLRVFSTLQEALPTLHEADAAILSDPRGPDGADLAQRLSRSDSRIKWVQFVTAGCEGLLAHDFPDSILITNQGGAVAPAVAEHGMALMLAMARRLDGVRHNMANEIWDKHFDPLPMSMEGKRLCIVGYGNIGRQLAKRARAFEMKITGVSRSATADEYADEIVPMDRLHEALGQADVVAVTIAMSSETRHVMNSAAFAACKPGAFFINLTRGETVDGRALQSALESGHLRAAAIDVTDPEPLPQGHPLWKTPNLIISPHMAGMGSQYTGIRIGEVVAENIDRFRRGKPLLAQINAR